VEFGGLFICYSTLNSASYDIKFAFVPICSRFSHFSTRQSHSEVSAVQML